MRTSPGLFFKEANMFQKQWPLLSQASEVRGETHAGRKVRFIWVSNSQPPGHKSDMLTTEPPRLSKPELGLALNHMHHFITNTRNHHKNLFWDQVSTHNCRCSVRYPNCHTSNKLKIMRNAFVLFVTNFLKKLARDLHEVSSDRAKICQLVRERMFA